MRATRDWFLLVICSLFHLLTRCVYSWIVAAPRPSWKTISSTSLTAAAATEAEEDDDDYDWLDTVSDAEALLACRAYLQRHNRLGEWNNERQQQRTLGLEQAQQSDAVGFFWDNPDELVYYDRTKRPQFLRNEDEDSDAAGIWGEEEEETGSFNEEENTPREYVYDFLSSDTFEDALQSSPMNSWRLSQIEDSSDDTPWFPNNVLDEEDDALTNMDSSLAFDDETAYFSHQKRSNAAKRKFQDPDWKEYWYERRWGHHTVPTAAERKQRNMNQKTQGMRDFLARPELCELDEETIAQAILTYRKSNERRSASIRRVYEERKTAPTEGDEKIPRDILYNPDNSTLAEERRRRGEIAARLYRKRLENQTRQNTTNTTTTLTTFPPVHCYHPPGEHDEPTPVAALQRITALLDDYAMMDPATLNSNNKTSLLLECIRTDLAIVARPTRLAGRKSLLRRMLNDLFGLRGKCVPTSGDCLQFVTQSTIADLVRCVEMACERGELTSAASPFWNETTATDHIQQDE